MISGGLVRAGEEWFRVDCLSRYEVLRSQDFNNDGQTDLVTQPVCMIRDERTLWLQDGNGAWHSAFESEREFICDWHWYDGLNPVRLYQSLVGELCYYKPNKFVLWGSTPWRVATSPSGVSFGIGDKVVTEEDEVGVIRSFYIYVDPQHNVVQRSAYLGFDGGKGQEYDLDQLRKQEGGSI